MTAKDYERHVRSNKDRLYTFARHFLGDSENAADVVQDVFERMWIKRLDIDSETAPAWMTRVARNLCIDAHRRRSVRRKALASTDGSIDELPGPVVQPDRATDGTIFRDYLEQALGRLGEPHRSIVILREIQDLKYAEISQALDIPMNTVKVYLHRARRTLRHELKKLTHGELAI